jgi:ROS/MUCR transcriptional regulator protein
VRVNKGGLVEGVIAIIELPCKDAAAFKTRRDVERYFGGKSIECLLCRQRFRRLGGHLAAKHEISVDEYRSRFGLPWSRGLTSAASVASSGWTDERKAKARKLARKNRFFERAHLTARRAPAPFLKAQAIQNLGKHAVGFGKAFEQRVHALFDKGLTDAAIARALPGTPITLRQGARVIEDSRAPTRGVQSVRAPLASRNVCPVRLVPDVP